MTLLAISSTGDSTFTFSIVSVAAVTGVEAGKFGGGLTAERPTPVGGPFHRRVVKDHRDPVPGQPDVELDPVGALFHSQGERRKGILGGQTGGAPVADHRVGVEVEEWVHGAGY